MFIVQVYVPVWFSIKTKPSCNDGPKHWLRMIQLSRSLPEQVKVVIDPAIQQNEYFAHPENLLLAMITDERQHIKQLALRRVLKARGLEINEIRKFCVPDINFDAKDYIDLINWSDITVTAPPLLSQIPSSEISSSVFEGNDELLPFIRFVSIIYKDSYLL